MSIICESCWTDSNRNGRCTNPACDLYREDDKR